MSSELRTGLGIIGAVLAVILCCGGPLFIAAVSAAGFAAWLSYSRYALIAAALIAVGCSALWLRRRGASAQDCLPEALDKATKHE
jgi:Flp pilus assembly protein TadB